MTKRFRKALFSGLCLAMLVTACGQKGPLRHPDGEPKEAAISIGQQGASI